jgi:tetratricopeptide (TPR) repeat protein
VTDAATPGVVLLDDAIQQEVMATSEQLRSHNRLDDVARHLLLAHLYLSYDLRSEAVAILQELPNAAEIVAAQRLLGDLYLEMGLIAEAQSAYARLLEVAHTEGLVEEEAAALVGIGHVACVRLDAEAAQNAWQQAQTLYREMAWAERLQTLDALLAKLAANCQ